MGGEARHQTAHVSMLALVAYPLSEELKSAAALRSQG